MVANDCTAKMGCFSIVPFQLWSILNNLFNGCFSLRILVIHAMLSFMTVYIPSPICTSFIMITLEIANNFKNKNQHFNIWTITRLHLSIDNGNEHYTKAQYILHGLWNTVYAFTGEQEHTTHLYLDENVSKARNEWNRKYRCNKIGEW